MDKNEWQPIETAPYCELGKRVPWVLVSRVTEGGMAPVITAYLAMSKNGSNHRVWYVNGARKLHFAPTHWMELPDAPEEGE